MNNDLLNIEGIGPKSVELLSKLNIYNRNDLISHYPFRYEVLKRSDISNLNDKDKIIIDGMIEGQPTIIYLNNNLKKIIFRFRTSTNVFNACIYNKMYLYNELKNGHDITIIGKFDKVKNTIVAEDIKFERLPETPQIESIYYTTYGLPRKSLNRFIYNTLESDVVIKDMLPDYIQKKYLFTDKRTALVNVHVPTDIISLKKARQRLKYEELFMYLLKMKYLKYRINGDILAIKREVEDTKIDKFIDNLPFKLTPDQLTCTKEIISDLKDNKRMNRLLQGDVGSGKTIVAFIATYVNFLSGYQTAIMVPTEILANQHFEEANNIFEGKKMHIEILTSSTSKVKKEEIYKDLESGKIDLIIGTQSLIQEKIIYKNLGLIITDEQHRFGVNQRTKFKNKGISPDVLSMSATPIPRTYALTVYGDVDISSIKTKPEGRKVTNTIFKKEKDIIEVLELMKNELDLKHQIYVIAPMIETGMVEDLETVTDLEEKMNKAFGKKYKIGVVHGKLDATEKNKILKNFESGKVDILISTTVIEVGINVKNASMIVIFNANYFGLATLHQLRGRVGRSDIQSTCLLVAKNSEERLKMLEKCNDGFEISEYDFINRGEGDIFGVRQSGERGLMLANLNKDYGMLIKAKEDVDEFMDILLEQKDKYNSIYEELLSLENTD